MDVIVGLVTQFGGELRVGKIQFFSFFLLLRD